MSLLPRPDLENIPAEVIAYIESLEAALADGGKTRRRPVAPPTPDEPPTTINVVTVSVAGLIKRTPRHHYSRQRRGGMGVFDLQTADDDAPAHLAIVDASDHLLLITDLGRAYRLPLAAIPETAVRGRGRPWQSDFNTPPNEKVIAALPAGDGRPYLALVSERGWVRRVRDGYLGPRMIPGMSFHNVKEGGYLTAAAWTHADEDLFIATRGGRGIRFNAAQVPTRGCLGLRVATDDRAVAIAGVAPNGGVFLLSDDGKGTIRQMSGFAANKSPGAGGKVAMKSDALVGAVTLTPAAELFIISRLGKLIRFDADEVPPKEGVVQGVQCITLRADEAVGVVVSEGS